MVMNEKFKNEMEKILENEEVLDKIITTARYSNNPADFGMNVIEILKEYNLIDDLEAKIAAGSI